MILSPGFKAETVTVRAWPTKSMLPAPAPVKATVVKPGVDKKSASWGAGHAEGTWMTSMPPFTQALEPAV
jgi:hypothetical protein